MHKIFVYGTLLSNATRPASSFVDAKILGKGTIPGLIYDLGWYPGYKSASVSDGECLVHGEVIEVNDIDLERLDAYEGVPFLYRRKATTAILDDGQAMPVDVYEYNDVVHHNDVIPHGDWIRYSKEQENEAA